MKKIALFILCTGLATAANARQAIEVAPEKSSAPATSEAAEVQAADAAKAKAKARERIAERDCLRHTGSRLLRAEASDRRDCAIGNGRAYTREDLESIGGNLGSSLRSLHPGIY